LAFADQVVALLERRVSRSDAAATAPNPYLTLGWLRLGAELARWRKARRTPLLWWRDDDAFEPSTQLRRLVGHAERAGVPLSLSVIPALLSPELCAWVNRYPSVTVLQHGIDHTDAGGAEEPTQFDPRQPPHAVAQRLGHGWSALAGFHRRIPVYVPPWNALTPNVTAAAAMVGLESISAWGAPAGEGRIDAHIELMRWGGSPRFAGRGRVLNRLRRALKRRRLQQRWDEPIGLLTHHLVHDDAAWRFLAALLGFEPLKRTARWPGADVLFGRPAFKAITAQPRRSLEAGLDAIGDSWGG
jgi:hypothetical protein